MSALRNYARLVWIALCFFALSCIGPTIAMAKELKPGDVDVRFGSKKCGENGVYTTKNVVWVVVVGSSGGLNCIISLTEKLLRASSFSSGYACVSAYEAKPADIVSENDPRALREAKYTERLAQAKKASKARNVPVNVVYITTSNGPPHPEPRRRAMLTS